MYTSCMSSHYLLILTKISSFDVVKQRKKMHDDVSEFVSCNLESQLFTTMYIFCERG